MPLLVHQTILFFIHRVLFCIYLCKKSGYDPLSAGFISLASFLILIPQKIGVLELLPNPALIKEAAFSEPVKPLQPLIEQSIFET